MYEPARIFRSLLLCSVIYTVAYSIQIANALDTTYEIGGVTRTSEFIPNPAGANGSKAVYTPNSATKMPNGTKIPYGLRGTLRTGSKLFKWLLAAETGIEVIDWISSQYILEENQKITTDGYIETSKKTDNYICDIDCYWSVDDAICSNYQIPQKTYFAGMEAAIKCTQEKLQNCGACSSTQTFFFDKTAGRYLAEGCKNPNPGPACAASTYFYLHGNKEKATAIGKQEFYYKNELPEPTIAPDPYQTGQIIEYYAAKVPQSGAEGWEAYISPNVQILDQPIRWTELPDPAGLPTVDTITDLIRVPGYEPKPPALIPDPEPLRPDPDGLKKIPNPLLQGLPDPNTPNPPPAVRTQDLIGGGMTVTNTYNIQNTSTAINLNIENKEITYAGNEEEIKPPADLTETETLEARQRLLIPTTDETFMNSYVQNILSKVKKPEVNLLSDSSARCPPPRRLALFGTTEIELSYDGICQFLPMVKVLMLGFIGFALFGVWIKRISSS